MHIHELRTENFKRIKVAKVVFPPNGTVEIYGKNGQGKSSLIDSIFGTLAGSKASPEQPIRTGSRSASCEVNLGDIIVKREWDSRGTRLTVTDADGVQRKSPQGVLDALFSKLAFDPMQFSRARPEEQAETLRQITGLDFRELDRERAGAYAERTQVNKSAKQAEALLAELPEVEKTEEVQVSDLNAQLRQINAHNRTVAAAKMTAERKANEVAAADREVRSLETKLMEARNRLAATTAEHEKLKTLVGEEQDTDEISWNIEAADSKNKQARAYAEREAAVERLRQIREQAEDLTTKIEQVDSHKLAQLAAAKMPVEGLGLDGDIVTFNSIPFAQISTSEQIRVSLAMTAAMNAKLKLIIIKEGSLLDDGNLRLVADWAAEHDFQIIVERVADRAVRAGVMIEEGEVKETVGAAAAIALGPSEDPGEFPFDQAEDEEF